MNRSSLRPSPIAASSRLREWRDGGAKKLYGWWPIASARGALKLRQRPERSLRNERETQPNARRKASGRIEEPGPRFTLPLAASSPTRIVSPGLPALIAGNAASTSRR